MRARTLESNYSVASLLALVMLRDQKCLAVVCAVTVTVLIVVLIRLSSYQRLGPSSQRAPERRSWRGVVRGGPRAAETLAIKGKVGKIEADHTH